MATSAKKKLHVRTSRTIVSEAVRSWWEGVDMPRKEVITDMLPERFDVAYYDRTGDMPVKPEIRVMTYIVIQKGRDAGWTTVGCQAVSPTPLIGLNAVKYLKNCICWLRKHFRDQGIEAELSDGMFEQRVKCD